MYGFPSGMGGVLSSSEHSSCGLRGDEAIIGRSLEKYGTAPKFIKRPSKTLNNTQAQLSSRFPWQNRAPFLQESHFPKEAE